MEGEVFVLSEKRGAVCLAGKEEEGPQNFAQKNEKSPSHIPIPPIKNVPSLKSTILTFCPSTKRHIHLSVSHLTFDCRSR